MRLVKQVVVCAVVVTVGGALAPTALAGRFGRGLEGPLPTASPVSTAIGAAHASRLAAHAAEVLTRKGLSSTRAGEALAVQGEIGEAGLVRKLAQALAGQYAGVWFEPATAQLHVGVTSRAGMRVAEQLVGALGMSAAVVYTPVRSTKAQLLAVQKAWNRKLASLMAREQAMTGVAPQDNAVSVKLSSSIPMRERSALEREAANADANVAITVVPPSQLHIVSRASSCPLPFKSGEAYCGKTITEGALITPEKSAKPGRFCTAGPLGIVKSDVTETRVITAGHCISAVGVGEVWYSSTPGVGQVTEPVGTGAQFVTGTAGDYGDVEVEAGGFWTVAGNEPVFAGVVEWGKLEETSMQVDGEEESFPKLTNCRQGAKTGEQCGEVLAENITFAGTQGLIEDRACGEEGDSGGPWINISLKPPALRVDGSEAKGPPETCVGHTCETCRSYYEPIKTELAGLSLELLTKENENRAKDKEEKEFTGTSGGSTLKAGGELVACAKGTIGGELTSAMLFGEVVVHFLECKSSSASKSGCEVNSTNTSVKGLILTNTLQAVVGLVLPSRGGGLLLLPASGKTWDTLASNACTPETTVTGTLAGLITPTGKSEKTSKVTFSTSSSKQEINDIDTLAGLVKPELTAFGASATEETTEEVTWGKAIEVP